MSVPPNRATETQEVMSTAETEYFNLNRAVRLQRQIKLVQQINSNQKRGRRETTRYRDRGKEGEK